MKKIVIIGGGTAGWLSSLYLKKYKSDLDVILIDSSKIDILGAGEGTTPNMPGMFSNLDIDVNEFIKKTNATKKVGIDFINWSPNGGQFNHGFLTDSYGFHFDARLTSKFLKEIAIERGVQHIDGVITHFTQSENGNVTHINLEGDLKIECDFIFDCSGYARLVIGKLFKGNWVSYSEHLKSNRAISFFLPQKEKVTFETETKTQSIAMKYGWMWKIPLQHRYGSGYVFNDNYITIEDAKKEVEEYIGQEIDIVKTFNFNPGSYEKPWINNCAAMGLASGFIEPLEATSLMILILSIQKLIDLGLDNLDGQDSYNNYVSDLNHQTMLFICHHYNCGRTDTEFWREINQLKLPSDLTNIIDNLKNIKNNQQLSKYFQYETNIPVFGVYNYKTVDSGHKIKTQKTLM